MTNPDHTGKYPIHQPSLRLVYRDHGSLAEMRSLLEDVLIAQGIRLKSSLVFPANTSREQIRAITLRMLNHGTPQYILPDETTTEALHDFKLDMPLGTVDQLFSEALFRVLLGKSDVSAMYDIDYHEKDALTAFELILRNIVAQNPDIQSCVIVTDHIADHGVFKNKHLLPALMARAEVTAEVEAYFTQGTVSQTVQKIITHTENRIAEVLAQIATRLGLQTTLSATVPANDTGSLIIHDRHNLQVNTARPLTLPLPVSQAYLHAVHTGMTATHTVVGFERALTDQTIARVKHWYEQRTADLLRRHG